MKLATAAGPSAVGPQQPERPGSGGAEAGPVPSAALARLPAESHPVSAPPVHGATLLDAQARNGADDPAVAADGAVPDAGGAVADRVSTAGESLAGPRDAGAVPGAAPVLRPQDPAAIDAAPEIGRI